jgi:hypothetical protein
MPTTTARQRTTQRNTVRDTWREDDLELLETISADDHSRNLFLRLARHQREGGLDYLLAELASDDEIDDETAAAVAELVTDGGFLRAVEDYVELTALRH